MDLPMAVKILTDLVKIDNIKLPSADILTVAHDNVRNVFYEGRWYSPLIDSIEDELAVLNIESVSVARIVSRIKGNKAYGNVFSPEGAFARALISKRLKSLIYRNQYPFSNMEEKIWGNILDVTGVRKVIAILPSRELCVACHKRGIWVADIQHGVIADTHPWYGINYRNNDPREQLPDAFVCWDYGSSAVIDRWAQNKGIQTIVIGSRWVKRFLNKSEDDDLVCKLFAEYENKKINQGKKPSILVTLSWGNKSISNGFLPDSLCEIIRETSKDYHWFVRLHPHQLIGFATSEGRRFKDKFIDTLGDCVEWEVASQFPLPLILLNVNMHISWSSSCSIEAAQMGIKSALLDPALRLPSDNADYYSYYRNKGMIHLMDADKKLLYQWIHENCSTSCCPEDFSRYDLNYLNLINNLSSRFSSPPINKSIF
jgi:hypothetical protein